MCRSTCPCSAPSALSRVSRSMGPAAHACASAARPCLCGGRRAAAWTPALLESGVGCAVVCVRRRVLSMCPQHTGVLSRHVFLRHVYLKHVSAQHKTPRSFCTHARGRWTVWHVTGQSGCGWPIGSNLSRPYRPMHSGQLCLCRLVQRHCVVCKRNSAFSQLDVAHTTQLDLCRTPRKELRACREAI